MLHNKRKSTQKYPSLFFLCTLTKMCKKWRKRLRTFVFKYPVDMVKIRILDSFEYGFFTTKYGFLVVNFKIY